MRLRSSAVAKILKENRVTRLYHANSVLTACEFLRAGALLSRGFVEDNGLLQTPQESDETDKEFNVWHDVFVDSVDIHDRINGKNHYGPVLFVFDVALTTTATNLRVTQSNPIHWYGAGKSDRWFRSIAELKAGFIKGEFGQMIVFRNLAGRVRFRQYLKEIVLDDPKYIGPGKRDLYSLAYGALVAAKTFGRVTVPIRRRVCTTRCACVSQYQNKPDLRTQMFWPILKAAA